MTQVAIAVVIVLAGVVSLLQAQGETRDLQVQIRELEGEAEDLQEQIDNILEAQVSVLEAQISELQIDVQEVARFREDIIAAVCAANARAPRDLRQCERVAD